MQAVFTDYEPYARDVFTAMQIASLHGDSAIVLKLMAIGARQGITLEHLALSTTYDFLDSLNLIGPCKDMIMSERGKYRERLLPKYRQVFMRNYNTEQAAKAKPGFSSVVNENFGIIRSFIRDHGFPSERNIGIDNCDVMNSIRSRCLRNAKIMATLLHKPYSFSELKPILMSAMEKGELHPYDFAYIYGFEMGRVSKLYDEASKPQMQWNFNSSFEPKTQNLEKVNKDRHSIGMMSLELEKELKEKERSLKIDLGL